MQNDLKTEQLTMNFFEENLEESIDRVINKEVDKLIITTPFQNDVVVLPIKEYEELKILYDKVVNKKQKD
ncbi:MAG: hypothetical protein PHY66_08235 [Aliarcobacter sp.]|nr:hypothetical protein [Aliarcobacter sp.]MDD2887778.1 hypothetical protein [Aliarcobacter sp.]